MTAEERFDALERRVSLLELENDNGLLSTLLSVLGPEVYESLSLAVEQGVANYFGVNRDAFHENLIFVRNRTGRKGKLLADDPRNINSIEDKIVVARNILYGILHVDFCIPIQDLSVYYSVNVKNYVREWKTRYIRIFHSDEPDAKNDSVYRKYWMEVHEAIIAECHRVGIYDKLLEKLKRFDINGEVSYIYLKKWRID